MKKRILLYCALSAEGGIETHILALSQALAAAGHEVTVGAKWVENHAFYAEALGALGVRLVVAPAPVEFLLTGRLKPLGDLMRTLRLFWMLKPKPFDLVAVHARGSAGRLMGHLAKAGGVLTYHEHLGNLREYLQRPGYRRFLSDCSFVTVNSKADQALLAPYVREALTLPAMTAVPGGQGATKIPSTDGTFRVAFVGNLAAADKGARKLWELWQSGAPKGCSLHFFGRGHIPGAGGPQPQGVWLHGSYVRSDIARVFGQIDLLVHPAHHESLGLVLVEAMAFGVPVLCTRVGGMIDLVEGNPDAAFTKDDPKSLHDAIVAMKLRVETGDIDPDRLMLRYHDGYSIESLGGRWAAAYSI